MYDGLLMRIVFSFVTLTLFAIVVVTGDIFVGWATDSAEVRIAARQFREEAAYLLMSTKNLRPHVDHAFTEAGDGTTGTSQIVRHFKTDREGLVVSGNNISAASKKILFLGGSTTECNEVAETLRFPSVVERSLREAGIDVAVANGGVRGHTTQDATNSLLNRSSFRSADIVVLMENINDRLRLGIQGNYDAHLGVDAPTSGQALVGSAKSFWTAMVDYITYRSNGVFMLQHWANTSAAWTGQPQSVEVTERSIDLFQGKVLENRQKFEENIRVFISLVRALGKLPVLMTQPLGRQSVAHDIFNDIVRDVAKREAVLLIDLERNLDGNRTTAFLSDQIHLNNHGSLFLGKVIANAIAPLLSASVVAPDTKNQKVGLNYLLKVCRPPPTSDEAFAPGKPHRIVESSTGRYPSFSPDGRFLVFQDWQAGRERIKAIDWTSQRLIDLTPEDSAHSERHPTFLSYNEVEFQIVFGATPLEPKKDLEQLNVRHWPSMRTGRLMNEPIGGAIPAVRDGRVYFPGFGKEGSDSTPDLYKYDLDQRLVSRLTKTPWEEWRPAVARDGTMFFIDNREGKFSIFEMKPSASNAEPVQRSSEDQWDPALSPDDRWLVFASKQHGNWDLFLLDRKNQKPAVRLTFGTSDEWDPSFHPNGKLLVFAASSGKSPHIFAICPFGE